MKLTGKIVVAIAAVIVALLFINAAIQIKREAELFDSDMRRDARLLGQDLGSVVSRVWRAEGQDSAFDLIQDVATVESHIKLRWVWLDTPQGDPRGPSLPYAQLGPLFQSKEMHLRVEGAGKKAGSLYTYVPVSTPGPRSGALEISESLQEEKDYIRKTTHDAILAAVFGLVLSTSLVLAIGVLFVGRPVRMLIEKVRRVAMGDLSGPVVLNQRDELLELALEVNAMCDRLAFANEEVLAESYARISAVEQLRHADRLITVGKLASGIAHELGTPLNVVAGRGQLLLSGDITADEINENARIIVDQAKRMTQIIRQLLDFARKRAPQKSEVDVALLTRQTLALLKQMADRRGVTLALGDISPEAKAFVDEGQIQQALTNVVANAAQATNSGGTVTMSVQKKLAKPPYRGASEATHLCIVVADTGHGMSPETMSRIFEPFFTTKGIGEGTGLGLSVTHGIVHEHGGWIDVDSEPGKGTTMCIYLPLAVNKETL